MSTKEESNGSQETRWQWDYRGLLWHHEDYRDHHIIFNGENVPVRAGTMVWNYPDYYDHSRKLHMSLDGRDANSFEVTYQTGYEHTFNEWLAASGGSGFRLAIWYKPHEGRVERLTLPPKTVSVAKRVLGVK